VTPRRPLDVSLANSGRPREARVRVARSVASGRRWGALGGAGGDGRGLAEDWPDGPTGSSATVDVAVGGKPPFARGWRRSLFGDSGLAQALENGLKLGEVRRVVAHRGPGGAGAGNRQNRVEREPRMSLRAGFLEPSEARKDGREKEMRICKIAIDFD
jgi:hypothetical protein